MVNQHRLHKHSPGRPAQKLAPRHSRLDMVEQYFCLLADELILPPVFAHIPWTPSNSPVRPASIWLWFKAMCRPAQHPRHWCSGAGSSTTNSCSCISNCWHRWRVPPIWHQTGFVGPMSVAPASPTPTRDGGGAASLGAGQLGARSICLCPLPPAADNGWQRAAGLLNVRCSCLAPGSNDDNMWLWGSGPVGPLCALCACLAYASNTNDGWRLSAEQLGQPRYTLRLLFLRLCQWWWVMVGHDL